MSLKQKSWTIAGVTAAGLCAAVGGSIGDSGLAEGLGFVLVVIGLALDVIWIRCPHCGVWLGKYPGEYCQSCGEKIEWDQK